jgi:hypothetical protein
MRFGSDNKARLDPEKNSDKKHRTRRTNHQPASAGLLALHLLPLPPIIPVKVSQLPSSSVTLSIGLDFHCCQQVRACFFLVLAQVVLWPLGSDDCCSFERCRFGIPRSNQVPMLLYLWCVRTSMRARFPSESPVCAFTGHEVPEATTVHSHVGMYHIDP